MRTRIGAATRRLLAMKLKEIGEPSTPLLAKGFVRLFRDEIEARRLSRGPSRRVRARAKRRKHARLS